MCGICGVFNLGGLPADARRVSAMKSLLTHRGPDDEGDWSDGPVALGFRRLSILDLQKGHQPMASADGRLVVVFNGEIYNHPQLKSELESQGAVYRTRSDTETILHLYERYGTDAFSRMNGMFAIGLWDRRKQELILARDPLGVKPLYYSFDSKMLIFASELRALVAAGVSTELDSGAILEYLSYGRVHAPRTALASAFKLLPGHFLRVNAQGLKIEKYWELPRRLASRHPWQLEEAQEHLEELLVDSVRGQLLSDVPLGAFLSGGVDSALVAALMTRASAKPVSTFTIGFTGVREGVDESQWASQVSRHLGTDHHELMLPADVLDRVEDLGPCLDEPVADSAILPTFLLARFARQNVKVVLTGEGADELFAGYARYKAAYLSEWLGHLPKPVQHVMAPLARRLGRGSLYQALPMHTLGQWAKALAESRPEALTAVCLPDFLASAQNSEPEAWSEIEKKPQSLNQALAFDLQSVLCDSLLMKVDKATMQASLEARVPYLDRRLVEFAVSLPARFKIRWFKGKYILRRLAARYLPQSVAWRRKHGFLVPWEEWVRKKENPLIESMLNGSNLSRSKIFQPSRLREMRQKLESGDRRTDAGLFFRIMILGLWLESL